MFLPVMRGTLSLPANRDPEILERLQPNHVLNMCSRLQVRIYRLLLMMNNDESLFHLVTLQFKCNQSRTRSNGNKW